MGYPGVYAGVQHGLVQFGQYYTKYNSVRQVASLSVSAPVPAVQAARTGSSVLSGQNCTEWYSR